MPRISGSSGLIIRPPSGGPSVSDRASPAARSLDAGPNVEVAVRFFASQPRHKLFDLVSSGT